MKNWLLDAASLRVFLASYGHRMNPLGLPAAYGIASSLALLPISPSSLGAVEGAPVPIRGLACLTLRAEAWLRPDPQP